MVAEPWMYWKKKSPEIFTTVKEFNYTTPELYAGLFFTTGKVCGEDNIVKGRVRTTSNKKGMEKHKEQLKMLFFNPGKKYPVFLYR